MGVQERFDRAYNGWGLETVEYDQGTTLSPTGHRDDCSGYVSMVLGLAPPGLDTVTLVSTGSLVAVSTPVVGDFLGRCGPGTGGNVGHVAIITGIAGNRFEVLEQRGGTVGPTLGVYQPLPSGWGFYRDGNLGGSVAYEHLSIIDDGVGHYYIADGLWRNPIMNGSALAGWANLIPTQRRFSEPDIDRWGRDVTTVGGGTTAAPVLHSELVQAAFEGAQKAERE